MNDIDAKAWAQAVTSEYDRKPLWLHLTDERTLALSRAVLSAYLKAADTLATPSQPEEQGEAVPYEWTWADKDDWRPIAVGTDLETFIKDTERNVAPIKVRLADPAKAEEKAAIAELIRKRVEGVCEWDDRTSPAEYPQHLVITPGELTDELRFFAEDVRALHSPARAPTEAEVEASYHAGMLGLDRAGHRVALLAAREGKRE